VTRWVRCFWYEEAVWFYFELDTDGYVIRQEPGSKALAAASLSVYGLTAEPPISEWEGHDPQWLSANEFEIVRATARRQLQDRQRRHPS
jgi:hypothetical protein